MTEFTLKDIISNPSAIDRGTTGDQTHRCDESFDAHLHKKLEQRGSQEGDVDVHRQSSDITFNIVRSLFQTAATALQLELNQHSIVPLEEDDTFLSHWVPGRIEVMGKHTDYAGGNSLVCATAGRGMAMVSTFISNDEKHNGSGIKITIVSVLPVGMEHHATTTAATYQVEGRPVVHHTINIPNNREKTPQHPNKEFDSNRPDTEAVDWTIYPTAVIHRLHQNFGLFPHSDELNATSCDNRDGGHIFIALSSNLPPASGLSTSSAFVTGLFLVLDSHFSLTNTIAYRHAVGKIDADSTVYNLSTYLGNVENGQDYINAGAVLKGTVGGGVGTFGGSEDHAAILMGRRNELRLLSFCPTRPAPFPMDSTVCEAISSDVFDGKSNDNPLELSTTVHLPSDLTFVIAYSGAKSEKAGGIDGATDASIGYNCASDLASKAFDAYVTGCGSEGLEGIQTLADAIRWGRTACTSNNQSTKARISSFIKSGALAMDEIDSSDTEEYSTQLVQRFEHFHDESEYFVPAAAHAISKRRYDHLGLIVDASHRGAVNSLKNQIEQTAWLPLWARGTENNLRTKPLSVVHANQEVMKNQSKSFEAKNKPQRIKALAASAFGAGFGGSCWALVYSRQAQEFAQQWRNAYEERFPAKESSGSSLFFETNPGPGAFCV